MKRSVTLTARGQLCILLISLTGAAALMTGDDHARLATSVLVAILLTDLIKKKFCAPRLLLRAEERRTHAGRVFRDHLLLCNESAVFGARHLRISEPRTTTVAGDIYVEDLPAGERMRVALTARCRHRSRIRRRVFVLQSTHPFGMLKQRQVLEIDVDLIVEPSRLSQLPAPTPRADRENELIYLSNQPGGNDFHSLREYRTGDDARHVHARRSAALAQLVTRVVEGSGPRSASVILDLRRLPGEAVLQDSRKFEQAMRTVATMIDDARASGCRLHLTVVDHREEREVTIDSAEQARDFLTFLSECRSVAYRPLGHAVLDSFREDPAAVWIQAGGAIPPENEPANSQRMEGAG